MLFDARPRIRHIHIHPLNNYFGDIVHSSLEIRPIPKVVQIDCAKESRNIVYNSFGSMYTDQLWVHPDHRKKGLGHKLMEAVHDYGRKSECSMATVATMSFQGAKIFYEKLGYVMDFERAGYTQNSSCIFLKRSL